MALGTFIVAGTIRALKGIKSYVFGMFRDGKTFLKRLSVILAIAGTIIALIAGAPVAIAILIGLAIFKGFQKAIKPIIRIASAIKKIFDKLPFMADGGVSQGGLTVVGEEGPELVQLPTGSRVFSNSDSAKMVAPTKGGTVNNNSINITINAKDTSKAEMDRIAKEVSRTITNSIQRQSNTSNLR